MIVLFGFWLFLGNICELLAAIGRSRMPLADEEKSKEELQYKNRVTGRRDVFDTA